MPRRFSFLLNDFMFANLICQLHIQTFATFYWTIFAKQDTNRSEEQIFLESLESEVDAANTWDRVGKLIDASNDTTIPTNADVTRMRKLFIQLKNEPLETTRVVLA